MALWKEFRVDLRRLIDEEPDALQGYPDPDSGRSPDERPSLTLAAWASGIAATLHEKYGDQIDLRVGAMPFPNTGYRPDLRMTQLHGTAAQDVGLTIELTTPLVIRTGRFTMTSARITNHSADAHMLMTNGHLDAAVTDADGQVVGRYTGPQTSPLVTFKVESGDRRDVPVLVGTDSLVPEMGYAVPPGSWSIVVELPTAEHVISTPLPCTITP